LIEIAAFGHGQCETVIML